jgi:hypothetical protein
MATDSMKEAIALGFESRDVNTRAFFYFLLVMGIFLVITAFAVAGLFFYYARTNVPLPTVARPFDSYRQLPPPPRIQTTPGDDIANYLQSEQHLLNSSGWIDQKNGVARIPIDRAMRLLLQRGLPVQNSSTSPPPANKSAASVESKAKETSPQKRSVNATH